MFSHPDASDSPLSPAAPDPVAPKWWRLSFRSPAVRTIFVVTIALALVGFVRLNAEDPLVTRIHETARKHGLSPENYTFCFLLPDGRVVGHREGTPMKPASSLKVLTAAVALEALGPAATIDTDLLRTGQIRDGVLEGDLVVVGRGDPQRVSSEADSLADLRRWAHLVAQLGIREVRGDLVGDDRYFAGPMRLADWPKQQWHRWYSAPCGALNLNDNCFDVTIAGNGESIVTSVFPETGLVTVDNQLTPVKDAKRHVYSIDRTPGSWTVVLRGRFLNPRSPLTEWVTIEDPTLAYVGALRYLLEESGVRVTGDVRRGAAPPDARLVDRVAHSIASYVPRLIKKSMNLHGDCLLRHFGRRGGSDGSFVQSAMAAESLLKERFGWNGPITMRDGSGLSHQNRINARDVVTLLRTVEDKPWGSILIDALPVAGKDGTLARRFRRSSVAGRVRAKTGHISGVTSLVGYLDTKAGRVTFAVLFNGPRSKVGKADRWHETLLEAVDASVAADSAAGRRGVK